jgi:hypothetical protein
VKSGLLNAEKNKPIGTNQRNEMNFYVTRASREQLKKAFLNMRKQHVISVPEIIEALGYAPDSLDDYSTFLINEEIKSQIRAASRTKRSDSIIYSNPDLNEESAKFVIFYVNENTEIQDIVFLTEEHVDEELYELFNAVHKFPTIKKVHVLECKPIDSTLFRWINNLPLEE